jgi:hypothetical protein
MGHDTDADIGTFLRRTANIYMQIKMLAFALHMYPNKFGIFIMMPCLVMQCND